MTTSPTKSAKTPNDSAVANKDANKDTNAAATLPMNPLSPEDQLLQSQLLDLVNALHDKKKEIHHHALQMIKTLIKNATASLTSVPKPLKFLREKYDELKELFAKWSAGTEKVRED